MDSEKVEPAPEPAPAPAPVQGHPAAQYTLFEKLLRKTAKILRQAR